MGMWFILSGRSVRLRSGGGLVVGAVVAAFDVRPSVGGELAVVLGGLLVDGGLLVVGSDRGGVAGLAVAVLVVAGGLAGGLVVAAHRRAPYGWRDGVGSAAWSVPVAVGVAGVDPRFGVGLAGAFGHRVADDGVMPVGGQHGGRGGRSGDVVEGDVVAGVQAEEVGGGDHGGVPAPPRPRFAVAARAVGHGFEVVAGPVVVCVAGVEGVAGLVEGGAVQVAAVEGGGYGRVGVCGQVHRHGHRSPSGLAKRAAVRAQWWRSPCPSGMRVALRRAAISWAWRRPLKPSSATASVLIVCTSCGVTRAPVGSSDR